MSPACLHVYKYMYMHSTHTWEHPSAPHKQVLKLIDAQTADIPNHQHTCKSLHHLRSPQKTRSVPLQTWSLLPTLCLPPYLPVLASSKAGILIKGVTGHLEPLNMAAACLLQHHTFQCSPAAAESRPPHSGSTLLTAPTRLKWHAV